MASIPANARHLSQLEYSIYIYHTPENQIEGQGDWERRTTSTDRRHALAEARRLLKTRNFKKVEIRRRLYNPVTRFVSDQTLVVMETDYPYRGAVRVLWCGIGAAVVGGVFGLVTHLSA